MRLIFDSSTIHQSRMGSVTGVVYFDFDAEHQFPAAGWNDFVVVLANWWLVALDQITSTQKETILRFMDGPYWIAAIAQEGSRLLLRCTEDRQGVRVVHETIVEAGDLKREVTGFGRAVARACAGSGIGSADLDKLKKLLPN